MKSAAELALAPAFVPFFHAGTGRLLENMQMHQHGGAAAEIRPGMQTLPSR